MVESGNGGIWKRLKSRNGKNFGPVNLRCAKKFEICAHLETVEIREQWKSRNPEL